MLRSVSSDVIWVDQGARLETHVTESAAEVVLNRGPIATAPEIERTEWKETSLPAWWRPISTVAFNDAKWGVRTPWGYFLLSQQLPFWAVRFRQLVLHRNGRLAGITLPSPWTSTKARLRGRFPPHASWQSRLVSSGRIPTNSTRLEFTCSARPSRRRLVNSLWHPAAEIVCNLCVKV